MADIAYQNKDIISKTFAENFKNKSLNVYGLNLPRIVDVLPTNLPAVVANELRIDNLFLLEDGSYAIIDYESTYEEEDKVKYLNYITRILARYLKEGRKGIKIHMIVIYTGDVKRSQVHAVYDCDALTLRICPAFLSEMDSDAVKKRLSAKIISGQPLTEEERMEFIVLPLSYPSVERKQQSIEEQVELAKKVENVPTQVFLLAGMLAFSDKIMDNEVKEKVRGWIKMTQIARMFEEEKLEAVRQATQQVLEEITAKKDAEIAERDEKLAEKNEELAERDEKLAQKDAEIARLKEMLEQKA